MGEPGEDARVHAEERGVVERRDPGVGPEVGGAAEGPQRRVGYANAYALSVAFTRVHGVRPGEHRAAARRRAAAA